MISSEVAALCCEKQNIQIRSVDNKEVPNVAAGGTHNYA
jgi:hypothetical protein